MDDKEVCGRLLSAPNRIRRTLCEAKIWAEAFSSWLPPRRPKADQPGLAAVRLPAIWINSALRPPAQPVALSNQERAILERVRSAQSHGEINLWPPASP